MWAMSQKLIAKGFAHLRSDVNDLVGDVLKLAFVLHLSRVHARVFKINIISLNIFYQLIAHKSCFYDAIIEQYEKVHHICIPHCHCGVSFGYG